MRMLHGYLNGKPRETRGVFSSGPPGEEDWIFIKNIEAYAPLLAVTALAQFVPVRRTTHTGGQM